MPARPRRGEVTKESKLSEAAIAEWVQVLEHSLRPRTAPPEGNGDGGGKLDEQEARDVTLLPADAQLQILRQQLEDAFAEVDAHIAALRERVEQAEARASAAKEQASTAEARASAAMERASAAKEQASTAEGRASAVEGRESAAEARAESAESLTGDLVAALQQLSRDLRRFDPEDNRPELEALRNFVGRVRDRLPTS